MNKKRMHKTAINERIELLEHQSDLIKKELEGEFQHTKSKVADILKVALGVGGGLLLSTIILKSFFGKQKTVDGKSYKPKRVYHKFKDQLIGEISSQALIFILGIAKDKIKTFLEQDIKTEKDGPEVIIREEES